MLCGEHDIKTAKKRGKGNAMLNIFSSQLECSRDWVRWVQSIQDLSQKSNQIQIRAHRVRTFSRLRALIHIVIIDDRD